MPRSCCSRGPCFTDEGYDIFGDLLRHLRADAGLTQDELAERSGLSVRSISDIERNRTTRPYRRSVLMLADALGLSGPGRDDLVAAARGIGWPPGVTGEAGPPPRPRARRPPRPAPRQLPPAMRHFAGRAAELKILTGLLDQVTGSEGTVVAAIGGTAGVGKTALALHWAHQAADRFPDGQLYVNMRGFDPARPAAAPAEVLRGFLHALHVPQARIPASLEDMTAQYRSLLAGRAMLVLLDNVRDAAQVRPLLPGGSACLVLVTSRNQLTGLAATEGAEVLGLDVLSGQEAADLLTQRLDAERLAAEPAAAADLIELCARLPLALSIAAARAASHRAMPLAELAAGMRDSRDRLEALDTEDAATSIRAVFSWSQANLSAPAARLFRLLGVPTGADISAFAAASLAKIPVEQARRLLTELTAASLAAQDPPGRFGYHDLLRIYAAERAAADEDPAELAAAIERLLTWYLQTASAAARVISPSRRHVDVGEPAPGREPLVFAGYSQATQWLDAERGNLMAAISQAARHGLHELAWKLPIALWDLFNLGGHRADWIAAGETGLVSARLLRDPVAEAWTLSHLAVAYHQSGNYQGAVDCYRRALSIRRTLHDRRGEAAILGNLGRTYSEAGQLDKAMSCLQEALSIFRETGQRSNQGTVLSHISETHRRLGQFEAAVAFSRRALVILRENGEQLEESGALVGLAQACRQLGRLDEAASQASRALDLARALGDRTGEAQALVILGQAIGDGGQVDEARGHLREAAAILDHLGDPQAAQVRGIIDDWPASARH